MRIEGMDASVKLPEYSMDRPQNQPQVHQAPPESVQRAKQEQKKASDTSESVQQNDRLVQMAVDRANKQMAFRDTSLRFQVHDKTGDMIVRIVDTNTKEVIREIPSEKILDMVANMLEMAGILVDEHA